jgi:hypothetical protein
MSNGDETKTLGVAVAQVGTLGRLAQYVLDKYGVSGVVLVALGYWAQPHVDTVVADHRQFLKDVSAQVTKLVESVGGIAAEQTKSQERDAELSRKLDQLLDRQGNPS